MRIPMRAARRLVAVGALGLAVSGPARAAAPEAALPASTIAFIEVEDVARFRAAFEKSDYGQLLADPALKPFKDRIAAKMDDADKSVKDTLGLTLGELLALPQGQAWLAVLGRDDPKNPVAVLITADAGANDAKMAEVMGRITEKAAKEGAKVSTEDFRDLKLTTLRSSKDEDKDKPPVVWTKAGTVYHIASDADAIKDYASNASGRPDSLASNEAFGAVRKKLGEGSLARGFVDAAQVLKLVGKVGGDNAQQILAQVQFTGIGGFKALGTSFALNAGEYDQVTKIFAYAPGEAQGLLKLFAMPAVPLKPEPWVPATAAGYQTFSWDLDKAYSALDELANKFQAGMLKTVEDQVAAATGGEGISFQKDLFGPLGDRFTVVTDYKKPITEKSQRVLFAVALDDSKAFQNTLNKLIALARGNPKKRSFQGTTIFDFDPPQLPNAGDMQLDGPISLAIAKDYLFITTSTELLEQVLRPGGASLGEAGEYQAVSKLLPEASSTLSFARSEESARLIYNMVKSGQLKKAIQGMKPDGGPDLSAFADAFDPEVLPDFSVFAKYLSPGGGFGKMDEDGFMITRFTTKKANP